MMATPKPPIGAPCLLVTNEGLFATRLQAVDGDRLQCGAVDTYLSPHYRGKLLFLQGGRWWTLPVLRDPHPLRTPATRSLLILRALGQAQDVDPRQSPRVVRPLRVSCHLAPPRADSATEEPTPILDVSLGGVRFPRTAPLEPGTKVWLTLIAPSAPDVLILPAYIMRAVPPAEGSPRDPWIVAAAFVNMAAADRRQLHHMVGHAACTGLGMRFPTLLAILCGH